MSLLVTDNQRPSEPQGNEEHIHNYNTLANTHEGVVWYCACGQWSYVAGVPS